MKHFKIVGVVVLVAVLSFLAGKGTAETKYKRVIKAFDTFAISCNNLINTASEDSSFIENHINTQLYKEYRISAETLNKTLDQHEISVQ